MRPRRQYWMVALAASTLLGVLFCAKGGALAFPGEPEGFGGLTWSAPRTEIEYLRYKDTDSAGMSIYVKPDHEPFFGQARLTSVEYGFIDGRLASVTLRVDSLLQYLLMKEEAFRLYGKGIELAGREGSYVWTGDNTEISLISNFVIS